MGLPFLLTFSPFLNSTSRHMVIALNFFLFSHPKGEVHLFCMLVTSQYFVLGLINMWVKLFKLTIKPKPQPFWQLVHALFGGCLWWQPPCSYYMVFDVGIFQTLGIVVVFTKLFVFMLQWRSDVFLCYFIQIGRPMEKLWMFATLWRNGWVTITVNALHSNSICLGGVRHESFQVDIWNIIL